MGINGASRELHLLELSVGEVPLVEVDGTPHVVLGRAITDIGLDVESQMRQLRRQAWSDLEYANVVAADGRVRRAVVCTVPVFLMYLASIEAGRVAPHARDRLIAYQRETRDVIDGYWTRGIAVNPRGRTPEQVASIYAYADDTQRALDSSKEASYWYKVGEGRIPDPPVVSRSEAYRRGAMFGHRTHERLVEHGLEVAALPPADDSPGALR
jgi:hypothetical protein